MQLPSSNCNYSELNYSLIFESFQKETIVVEISNHNLSIGSLGAFLEEIFKLDLKENQNYSLRLQLKRLSQTAVSQEYIFSKLRVSVLIATQMNKYIQDHHYTKLTVVYACVRACVRPSVRKVSPEAI